MILYIKQGGQQIRYRGKIYRTPIKLTINAGELKNLKIMMVYKSITQYEILDDVIQNNERLIIKNSENSVAHSEDGKDKNVTIRDTVHSNKVYPKVKVVKSRNLKDLEDHSIKVNDEEEHTDVFLDVDDGDILKKLLASV